MLAANANGAGCQAQFKLTQDSRSKLTHLPALLFPRESFLPGIPLRCSGGNRPANGDISNTTPSCEAALMHIMRGESNCMVRSYFVLHPLHPGRNFMGSFVKILKLPGAGHRPGKDFTGATAGFPDA